MGGAGSHSFSDWSADGLAQREVITGDENDALAGLDWRMPVDGLTVPLPGAQWRYGTRGEVWQIISGSRTAAITHGATASAVTRTLTRTDSAASALTLTSVETSTMNRRPFPFPEAQ